MVFTLCSSFSFKKKATNNDVYVMGISFCFLDSTIYFTEIQTISDVALTSEGFLPQRDEYSYQLKSYLEGIDGDRNHTCVTFFSQKREKLQKKVSTLTKKYMATQSVVIQTLSNDEFQFSKPEDYSYE